MKNWKCQKGVPANAISILSEEAEPKQRKHKTLVTQHSPTHTVQSLITFSNLSLTRIIDRFTSYSLFLVVEL